MESSPRNIAFTTNNFTHFGNAKERKHFVDLSVFHEVLFFSVFLQDLSRFLLFLPLLLASFPCSFSSTHQLVPQNSTPGSCFFSVLYTLPGSSHLLSCLQLPSIFKSIFLALTFPLSSSSLFSIVSLHICRT